MAPDPITHDRVYRALTEDFLEGRFRPGVRLDIHALADRHRASTTPVREAMQRMIGEQLFEANPEGGIRLAIPTTVGLASLYAWNAQHLLTAIRQANSLELRTAMRRMRERSKPREPSDFVWYTAVLFRSIGETTGNSEFASQIDRANSRLLYVRLAEAALFDNLGRELQSFLRNGDVDVRMNLRRRVLAYHRRRIRRVGRILDFLQAS